MSTKALTDRHIRGLIFESLLATQPSIWVSELSGGRVLPTDQVRGEDYKWLSGAGGMREWKGGRQARLLRDLGIQVLNKKFEQTIEVVRDDMTYDKIGQHTIVIDEMTQLYETHWEEMAVEVLTTNPTGYDGVALFHASHQEDESPTQGNITTNAAAGTDPTPVEFRDALMLAVVKLRTFKNGANKPLNTGMRSIRVVIPPSMEPACLAALRGDAIAIGGGAVETNVVSKLQESLKINYSVSPYLSDAAKFYVARSDTRIPSIIRQQLSLTGTLAPNYSQKGEGSEYEHDTGQRQYGIDCSRAAAPGRWQQIVRHDFT